MSSFLERRFQLSAHGTTVSTEAFAGLTTFLTMAYIVFVQPAVLSAAGMDFGAVMVATCLSTAIATTLMALLANYPIAVAPAMGHNFFFAYSVVAGMKVSWQVALGADAVGTVAGAVLGTSTVTACIESGAGVAAGGRTGLSALVTASLFLAALFLSPLVRMIGGGYANGTTTIYPVIASALIIVGAMVIGTVRDIDWKDPTEGVAFGVVAYAVLKVVTGRGRQVHPLLHIFAVLFVIRYVFLRG